MVARYSGSKECSKHWHTKNGFIPGPRLKDRTSRVKDTFT